MFNINTLREGTNLKKSKCLTRIAENGQTKMYQYLSGADADSTYTAQNIKYIIELHGDIDWSKIDDKTCLSSFLKTSSVPFINMVELLGFSLIILIVVEIYKIFKRKKRSI